ncbi:MAG: 16S rRNA (cytosine(1402)-N(4))-methyltransferase RsmH [Ferruginibacter sp.]|nr:16S rRNA (cytosine(1402)-N(4))-methyltransferase RsmH [Cytophagales bacterium]
MQEKMYHAPVLLNECIEGLAIRPDGVYVDVTFGGGGHSGEIWKRLTTGKLFAFDQDTDAKANAVPLESERFTLVETNFRHLQRYLKQYGVEKFDGLLADLGVSSHQIDSPERGFSTRFDADLDMRMDGRAPLTAQRVLRDYPEAQLHRIFGMYGEVHNARTLASVVVQERINHPLRTVNDLKTAVGRLAPRGKENKYFAQVFQALRIEVNDELKALEEMLEQATEMLRPGGRLVVMSYHSLEDRLVKNLIAKGKFSGEVEKDLFGNPRKPLRATSRKQPVVASEEELQRNPRARSAKLRIAEKI